MSIVGKKRVKPEVVLLLPRFSIHANIFWLWKLTSSLMVEKITFWHICMFFIFSFHVKHVWACLRFCISYWIFFTYRSFSFHIPSVLYFHICWIFRGKLAESGELQVKRKNHSDDHDAVDHKIMITTARSMMVMMKVIHSDDHDAVDHKIVTVKLMMVDMMVWCGLLKMISTISAICISHVIISCTRTQLYFISHISL